MEHFMTNQNVVEVKAFPLPFSVIILPEHWVSLSECSKKKYYSLLGIKFQVVPPFCCYYFLDDTSSHSNFLFLSLCLPLLAWLSNINTSLYLTLAWPATKLSYILCPEIITYLAKLFFLCVNLMFKSTTTLQPHKTCYHQKLTCEDKLWSISVNDDINIIVFPQKAFQFGSNLSLLPWRNCPQALVFSS